MTRATGSLAKVVYGEETTFNVAPSPFGGHVISSHTYGGSAAVTKEELVSDVISANRARQENAVVTGNQSGAISVPFNLSINGLPRLMKHALGPVVTTGSGPYTHTIKRGALPIGMHFEYQYPDISTNISHGGGRVNSLSANIANSGLIAGTLEVLTAGSAAISGTALATSPTTPTHKPIHHKSATSVQEGGSAAEITGLEWNIANNLDDTDYVIGNVQRKSLVEGIGDLTGTLMVNFENDAFYKKWLEDTKSSLKISLVWDPGNEEMTIDIPNIRYIGEVGPGVPSSQGITLTLPWRAMYDATAQSDIVVTVINSEATL